MRKNTSKFVKAVYVPGHPSESFLPISNFLMEQNRCCNYVVQSGMLVEGYIGPNKKRKMVLELDFNGYEDGCYCIIEPGEKIPKLMQTEDFVDAFISNPGRSVMILENDHEVHEK